MNSRLLRSIPVIIALLMLGLPSESRAAILKVAQYDSDQYSKIQIAVDAAHNGDIVLVADGTYTGNGNRDIDFHGKSLTVKSQNGPTKTIIDCGGYKSNDGSGNHRGFYLHSGETKAVISGFTIRNGYEGSGFGGGVCIANYDTEGTVDLTDCIVTTNFAHMGGGVFYGHSRGGSGTVTLNDCTLSRNTAQSGAGFSNQRDNNGLGGSTGTIKVINCVVAGNVASGYGGGFCGYNDGGTITLINCFVSRNSSGFGGAFSYSYNAGGAISLVGCTISRNTGKFGGGLYYSDNRNTIRLTDCLLFGNIADSGGALFSADRNGEGSLALTHSTVSENAASFSGGGFFNFSSPSGVNRFVDCIFFGNKGGAIAESDNGTHVIAKYSDIQGGFLGVGNINADPLFADAPAGDFHLKLGSPCLGMGAYRASKP